MIEPGEYKNEKERLKELKSYSILDTLSEEDYDDLTAIAAEICNTPISLVSLIDSERQWFKSNHGLKERETDKKYAFCAHAIHKPNDIFIVKDATKDERFHDNPLVKGNPHVIFYAGVPLLSENGLPLGTLCVIDNKSKDLSKKQIRSLKALSRQVMKLLELRKNKIQLQYVFRELRQKNKDLKQFAMTAAHDIKSPLINISTLAKMLLDEYSPKLDEEGVKYLELMNNSTSKLTELVESILEYSRYDQLINEDKNEIQLEDLIADIKDILAIGDGTEICTNSDQKSFKINKTAIEQVLINLIGNAVKYNNKSLTKIEVGLSDKGNLYEMYVKDNGPGIGQQHQDKIFQIFEKASPKDRYGNTGNGIGLATVKKIVSALGGSIKVDSTLGDGATFTFTFEK